MGWFSVLDEGGQGGIVGFMPRAMRVEYPGTIYHVMDRGDRQEDTFMIATAKGAKGSCMKKFGISGANLSNCRTVAPPPK